MATIYIELLNEGTFCLRPVQAVYAQDDVYVIDSSNADPDDEQWAFSFGDRVKCEPYKCADGAVVLRAVSLEVTDQRFE